MLFGTPHIKVSSNSCSCHLSLILHIVSDSIGPFRQFVIVLEFVDLEPRFHRGGRQHPGWFRDWPGRNAASTGNSPPTFQCSPHFQYGASRSEEHTSELQSPTN